MSAAPPSPFDENTRLARLRELMVLDSAPEPLFDGIAKLASEVCGVPISLISLIDTERQWFKANVGLPGVNETPRDQAFCAHAIKGDALFEVPDATLDARFADNPLVTGGPDIRFYAGAPLVMQGGERVGTLCVIDRQAHRLDAAQTAMLHSLAAIASQALQMRQELITRSLLVRSEYEQAMAVSEAQHRALVEGQTEMVSLAKPGGELVYVNPAYARHFGLQPADMLGANLFDWIAPADRDAVRGLFTEVLNSGGSRASENRMVAHDGRERRVAWTNTAQRSAGGEWEIHSVGRDVTERWRAQQALQASQAFLARTGQVAGVGGWELVLATGEVTWSDETRRIHEVAEGYQPTLAGGLAFYAPEARPVIESAVQHGMASGQPWDLELPFITAAGRRIWVRTVGEVRFENGRPVSIVGAFQDITERKQLQQKVDDSERFVRSITDSLPVRIAYVDADLRFRFVNPAYCARFGLDEAQILGRTRIELLQGAPAPDDHAELAPKIAAVLAGQAQRYELDETVGDTQRRFESQLLPDLAPDGTVRGFFVTGIDITERAAAEKSLRLLTMIFDNTTDYVVQTDAEGMLDYMNPALRKALGIGVDQPLTRQSFSNFNTPQTQARYADEIVPTALRDGVWLGESVVYGVNRREVTVSHMVIAHRDPAGQPVRYSAVMRNISERAEAEQTLKRQTATLHSVIEAIPAMVAVIGADGVFRFVNKGFERWLDEPRERILGSTLARVLGPAEYAATQPWIDRVMAGESVNFERYFPDRSEAAHLALSYVPLRLDDGVIDGFVSVAQDITHHKQEQGRLLRLSQRDTLTGLLNRAGFEEHLERSLQAGEGASLALLYIDLDHFKPVNDQHGHPVGDLVLHQFAQRLRKLVRPSDAVARLGGDEFAIVLCGLPDGDMAHAVADKVIAAARTPFICGSLQLHIGASVGVSFGADPVLGWHELLARADALLYAAKAAGRGQQAGALAHG